MYPFRRAKALRVLHSMKLGRMVLLAQLSFYQLDVDTVAIRSRPLRELYVRESRRGMITTLSPAPCAHWFLNSTDLRLPFDASRFPSVHTSDSFGFRMA